MKKNISTTRRSGPKPGAMRERNKWLRLPATLAVAVALAAPGLAGAASYTWNVTNGNWSTPTSWTLPTTGPNGPLATDAVVFGINNTSSSSSTVNNIVDAGFAGTVANLLYNSTNVNTFHVTQIGPSQTLTVTNSFEVGFNIGVQLITEAFMTGGGKLAVIGTTNFLIESYGSASGANSQGILDLSGLGTFIYSNSIGTISIADNSPPGISGGTRAGGTLILAGVSNFIKAATINVGTCNAAQAGPNDNFTLGAGTNVINLNTLNLANNKNSATNSFKGGTGGLRLRGLNGGDTDRANLTLGNRNQSGTGTCAGSMLFNGGVVDIKANALIVGTNNSAGTTGDTGTGVLQFDTGTIDATTVIMGASVTASGAANGTVTVGANATLTAGAGGISLVTQTASGVATGNLNISNGTVNCAGNLTVGSVAGTSAITFIGGGKLGLGANSFAGTTALPIGTLTLDINSVIQFALPLLAQTNIVVNTLNWPSLDTNVTFVVTGLPAGLNVGSQIPLLAFLNGINGTVTAPKVILPAGVAGNVSQVGNTIVLTLTGGVGPGIGGVNQLANPGLELTPAKTGWTTGTNTSVVTVGTATYLNSTNGPCHDATAQLVVSHTGTNVANIGGANTATNSVNAWSQSLGTVPGSTYTSSAYTYISHEDLLAGKNSFYYAVNFLDQNGALLSAYQSYVVSNLTCGETTPFALDTWVLLAVTNQMQVTGGVNTGVVISNSPTAVVTAPPGAATIQFKAVFVQQGPPNNADKGSVYFDDANLGLISGPVVPTVTAISPNLVTLCTNTTATCSANSTVSVITNVQVILRTTTLGGITTNSITNNLGAAGLTVTGIGTANVNISFALTPNTIYRSIVVRVIDANGVSATSTAAVLDTIQPSLIIEASDFNFNGGSFLDTPTDGGLALFVNQVGTEGVDEHKNAARQSTRAYYRPSDEAVLQPAAPGAGSPPSSTEQKFVTAGANGDTNDVEVEIGFNSAGDWFNYSRTYGQGGSAPAGSYNIWCYEATSGTGVQGTMSLVTSDPTQPNQTTTNIGSIGTASFTDNGFNNYVYVPVVDQFGNPVAVNLPAGTNTLRATVVANPNFGFFMLVPVAPILTPVLQRAYPDGSVLFQYTNLFSFTVSPAQGAAIPSSGIGLVLNGVNVAPNLSLSQSNGVWTGTLPIAVNMSYSGVLTVTNNASLSSTFVVNFDTFNISNFTWEAVDYDFSTNNGSAWVSGLFIDNPVPTCDVNVPQTGNFATNSYYGYPTGFTPGNDPFGQGALAQEGIDMHFPNDGQTAASEYYRNDGVGSQPATDFVRPQFLAAQQAFSDPNIGELNIAFYGLGFWLNYTRTYPTNTFNVWGRLAGGAGAFGGTTLSVVTSGVGTANQTSNVIGSFADSTPAGWQSYHWVPLRDTNGNLATLPLGGVSTLKVTSGNNVNPLFFMLTPALVKLNLTTTISGGQINISIPTQIGHTYTLMHSGNLAVSGWTPVGSPIMGDGTVHVISQPATDTQGFYRVQVQ